MNVAETSLTAYGKIKPKLGTKQLAVYEAIGDMGVATNEQIADYLGWPINCVTGRVSELKKYGAVDVEGVGVNKSGHSAKRWSIRDMNDSQLKQLTTDCGA